MREIKYSHIFMPVGFQLKTLRLSFYLGEKKEKEKQDKDKDLLN